MSMPRLLKTKRKQILNTRKRQLRFLGNIIRKGDFENLILTGPIKGKMDRRKGRITFLANLTKWIEEQFRRNNRKL